MKNYLYEKQQMQNEALDMLYSELTNLPTQYLLDRIDDHDCSIDMHQTCECIAFIRELDRRMNKESQIL